jgi:6-carboxyhexanoate--CoA ligase
MRIHRDGAHLSGAEDLVLEKDLGEKIQEFSRKLFPFLENATHLSPVQLIITVDPIPDGTILERNLLPVQIMNSHSKPETLTGLHSLLSEILQNGSASKILDIFHEEILSKKVRNGAFLITPSGKFLMSDLPDGVRTTHVGCEPGLRKHLEQELSSILQKPNHRFLEALILSSKVLSSEDILLELCVSDDPHYSTGYMASRPFGYVRIPHLKPEGHAMGGRLYVVKENVDLPNLLGFLRTKPVLFIGTASQNPKKSHKLLTSIPLQYCPHSVSSRTCGT